MRSLIAIACLVLILGSFTISNGQKMSRHAFKITRLTEANDGETITIYAGQYFRVILANQSGGGYRFDKAHYNRSILHLAYHAEQPPAPNATLGHPGEDVWQFTALKKGKTTLKITASRPWNRHDSKTMFTYTIIVK